MTSAAASVVKRAERRGDARLRGEGRRERREQQNSQPTPSATRPPAAAADEPRREKQRAEPARDRDAGEQPQPPDLALAGLAQQLEPQRRSARWRSASICCRSSSSRW